MLLVEVQAAGVNYGDVLARSGRYPAVKQAPFVLGFEVAGLVKEVGKSVNGFKVGDSVAALTQSGGYASHILIPAETAIPLPKQLDPALAPRVLVQGLTASSVQIMEQEALIPQIRLESTMFVARSRSRSLRVQGAW